jgi:hypothetical protein
MARWVSLAVACFAMGSVVEAFAPGPLKIFGQQHGTRQLSAAVCRQAKMQAAGGDAGVNGASSRVRRELLQVDTERKLSVQRQGLRGRARGVGGWGGACNAPHIFCSARERARVGCVKCGFFFVCLRRQPSRLRWC